MDLIRASLIAPDRNRHLPGDIYKVTFQISYNYDGCVAAVSWEGALRQSLAVYPKIGIVDVVVNVCLRYGVADEYSGSVGLMLR